MSGTETKTLPRPQTEGTQADIGILFMALDEGRRQTLIQLLDDDEIRYISRIIANLGKVAPDQVDRAVQRFYFELGNMPGAMVGTAETTQRMLRRLLPEDKVSEIMDEICGPQGRTMWEKLANISPEVLAAYLRTELAQTAAVVLGKLPPPHAARVLALLPDASADEIVLRMVRMDSIQKHVLTDIETTLQHEFINNMARSYERDSSQIVAEILNRTDKTLLNRLMAAIEAREPQTASRIRRIMFTFDDLIRVDPSTFGALVAECPADKLQVALAGASDRLKDLFLGSMSERAANMLRDEIEMMPTQRRKTVEDAQGEIITIAKRLADEGRIFILDEDEM
jgi:flagellar motor switch protein FliG